MRLSPFIAAAAVALVAAQDAASQRLRGPTEVPGRRFQCFNGKDLAGVTRAGPRTLYVQSKEGEVFNLKLISDCPELKSAQKITVRVDGGDMVCANSGAAVVVHTAAGRKNCLVSNVTPLTKAELAGIKAAQQKK